MRHTRSICGFLLLALTAAGAQVASHAPTVFTKAPDPKSAPGPAILPLAATGRPVARVNGTVLTDTDLVREEFTIFPYARQHNGIPKELEPQIRSGALKMIIFEELVYQEALREKKTVPAAQLQRFRKQFPTPEEFKSLLEKEFHGSQQLLQEKIRRSLLIDAFLKAEVEDKSTVSPAEIRSNFDNYPARFEHPESYTFQTISILPPDNATADQLKQGRVRAEQALRQAKATKTAEEFGLLAEKISDDDYRVMMGQHKPVPVVQLAPPVLKALLAMKAGDVSNLIQMDEAYSILRLQEHTPAGKARFEDVRAQLQKDLQKNKTDQVRAALGNRLRQNAKIEEL